MKQELELFNVTWNRSSNIIKLGEAFKAIPPTYIKAEKVLSGAKLFITNIRTAVRFKSIDQLSFLKPYFENDN